MLPLHPAAAQQVVAERADRLRKVAALHRLAATSRSLRQRTWSRWPALLRRQWRHGVPSVPGQGAPELSILQLGVLEFSVSELGDPERVIINLGDPIGWNAGIAAEIAEACACD